MTHSYTLTESWTYTYNEFRPTSNLITIPVQCCEFSVGVVGTRQGRNLLGDDQNLKIGREVLKEENQISRGELFFLFYHSKFLSHFVPVSPDIYTKR